jgi:hypothetical protein
MRSTFWMTAKETEQELNRRIVFDEFFTRCEKHDLSYRKNNQACGHTVCPLCATEKSEA